MIARLAVSSCAVIILLAAPAAHAALTTHSFVGEAVFAPASGRDSL